MAIFGIPHSIISDNGPQFIGKPYLQLIKQYHISHVTSPHHPCSHKFFERAIRTVKAMMKKDSRDTDMAILAHRTTPLGPQLPSPAELVFGWKIGNILPIATSGSSDDQL